MRARSAWVTSAWLLACAPPSSGDAASPEGATSGDAATTTGPSAPASPTGGEDTDTRNDADASTSSAETTGRDAGTVGEDTSTGEPASGDDESTGTGREGLGCTARTDLLSCVDFEDGGFDETAWTIVEQNGATVAVDDTLAVFGEHSLRVHVPAADGARGGLRTTGDLFALTNNHFFGRGFVLVTPEVPLTHGAALAAWGDLDGAVAQYRLDVNGGELNSRYTHEPTVDQHGGWRKFGYELPASEWLCVEWEYDGNTDQMRYWMNGAAITDMTVTSDEDPPWVAPIFEAFELGFRTYQAGSVAEGYDVYWDEIALAEQRIGCGE